MTIDVAIRKTLGTFRLELEASSDARTLGVLGPSGSGKSTLLDCIAGIERPDEGHIRIGDQLTDIRTGLHLKAAARGVGYVFQDGLLFPHLSVLKNLRYGLGVHGLGPSLDEVVHVLELGELLGRKPKTLSGGEARRVAIGRALLSGPRLLLLDEPLSGLDRTLAVKTLYFLRQVVETFHVPMLYVSHTPSDIFFLCDEAWIIREGRLVAAGPPRRLLTQGDLSRQLGEDFCTIVRGRRQDSPQEKASVYRVGNLPVYCAADDVQLDENALICIYADDVIVAREKPQRISARNVISAEVITVGLSDERAIITLRVDSQCPDWVVRLTPAAVCELQIEPGAIVFAIVKATSLQAVPIGAQTTRR